MKHSCYICGYKIFLEHHHIIPRAKNGSDGAENIIVLCPTCHREIHHFSFYSEQDLFELKHKRESDSSIGIPRSENTPHIFCHRYITPVDRLLK